MMVPIWMGVSPMTPRGSNNGGRSSDVPPTGTTCQVDWWAGGSPPSWQPNLQASATNTGTWNE
eukprot:6895720-Ditylum_brightwellii.AAC.1